MLVNPSSPPTFTRCVCGKDLLSSHEVYRSNSCIRSTFNAVKYSQTHNSGQILSKSSLELLPKELLFNILDYAYDGRRESLRLCCCSRPGTPYEIIRNISLAHRIVDTETLRLTCSTFHAWAHYRITHAYKNGHVEVDVSDVTELTLRLRRSRRSVLRRLRRDFPLLESVVLYLGNPGQLSNVRGVVALLQEEHSKSKVRRMIKGVSFWDSDLSYKAPRKKLFMHVINATILKQPSFTTTEDRAAMFKGRVLKVLEYIWLGERMDEFATYTELYKLLAENISGSVYTQIPMYILRSSDYSGIVPETIHSILDACHHTVLRDFLGSDTAHIDDYMHELYDLVALIDPCYREDIVGLIRLTPQRFKRRILIDENLNFELNVEQLGKLVRTANVYGQKIEVRLRFRQNQDDLLRIVPRLNTKMVGNTACFMSSRLSYLEVTGGAANDVTLFGLLTVLSSSRSTLKSLIYLPSLSRTNDDGMGHHCPLLCRFDNLVNVHIRDFFCPAALKACQKKILGKSRDHIWRIDWTYQWPYSLLPCLSWKQELARERGANPTDHPCTTLACFLDDCRAAVATLSETPRSSIWSLEVVMFLTRYDWKSNPWRTLSCILLHSNITCANNFATETSKYEATFWPLENDHIAKLEQLCDCGEKVVDSEEVILRQWRSGIAWSVSSCLDAAELRRHYCGWDVGL